MENQCGALKNILTNGYIPGKHLKYEPLYSHFLPKEAGKKPLPWIIQLACSNLSSFYVEQSCSNFLQSLRFTRLSNRSQRSDGKKRDAEVISVLIKYTDLATMRFGIPQSNGSFKDFSYLFLAEKAGWCTQKEIDAAQALRTKDPLAKNDSTKAVDSAVKRVYRAMCDLKRAGYIELEYSASQSGKENYKCTRIKRIKEKLFIELGILKDKLKKVINKYKAKLVDKYEHFVNKHGLDKLNALFNSSFKQSKKRKRVFQSQHKKDKNFQDNKALQLEKVRQAIRNNDENKQLSNEEFYSKYPTLRP